MARYAAELFVQCVYSPDLTYDELLAMETALKPAVGAVLESAGAGFIHFEEMGDTMRVQCVLEAHQEHVFHAICDGFAPYMDGRVEARLLFVDKNLDTVHYYTISKGKWLEGVMDLPVAGSISRALLDQDPPA